MENIKIENSQKENQEKSENDEQLEDDIILVNLYTMHNEAP